MSNLLRWRQTVIMRSQKKKIMKKHNEGVNQRAFDGEMGRDISAYNHSGGSNSAILASIKLQRWWRIHWYKVRRLATIQIQSWWRHICYRRKGVRNIHDNDECWPCKDQSRWDKSQLKQRYDVLKVLGNGKLTKKLKVSAHRFSRSAREQIEKAGGEVVVLPGKTSVQVKKKQQQAAKK